MMNNEDKCKGLFFRGRVSQYMGGDGTSMLERRSLHLLKRMSCNSCEQCGWMLEDISEFLCEQSVEFFGDIEDGKIYTISCIIDGRDWETGYPDDWHYAINEYNPNPEQKDIDVQEFLETCVESSLLEDVHKEILDEENVL